MVFRSIQPSHSRIVKRSMVVASARLLATDFAPPFTHRLSVACTSESVVHGETDIMANADWSPRYQSEMEESQPARLHRSDLRRQLVPSSSSSRWVLTIRRRRDQLRVTLLKMRRCRYRTPGGRAEQIQHSILNGHRGGRRSAEIRRYKDRLRQQ
jgi:hypothetical protein